MEIVKNYIAFDGKSFRDAEECQRYEAAHEAELAAYKETEKFREALVAAGYSNRQVMLTVNAARAYMAYSAGKEIPAPRPQPAKKPKPVAEAA